MNGWHAIKAGIEIRVAETDDHSTDVAVRCVETENFAEAATDAVVRLFYRATTPGGTTLLLSLVDVVPLVPNTFTLTSFGVALETAAFVRVELLRSVQRPLDFFHDEEE